MFDEIRFLAEGAGLVLKTNREPCEICGNTEFSGVYKGSIRDGVFGKHRSGATVLQCGGCDVHRLAEEDCIPPEYYGSGEYRESLRQSLSGDKAVLEQDDMQRFTLNTLWPNSLRDKSILDAGCGVGSLLDMTRSISRSQIAVEPCEPYLESLTARGYEVYPSLTEAAEFKSASIDWAFSIQVIEHVDNPRVFLQEIRRLLKPGGRALISTPNRNEILMSLLNEEFAPFFYRTAHRWYFDESSLAKCAEKAGFEVAATSYVHKYGLANTMHWLRDKRPKGGAKLPGIDAMADQFWKAYLEKNEASDTIFMELRAPEV